MTEFVWILTFTTGDGEQNILDVFTSREKAVNAMGQIAKDCDEFLDEDWKTSRVINAYYDKQLTKPVGFYCIHIHELR